jgi:hypothetical protein
LKDFKKVLESQSISHMFLQSKIFIFVYILLYRLAKLRMEEDNFEDLLELNVS